jgi:5-hydroxyisourate hydrolase
LPESEPIERLSTHVLDVAIGRPAEGIPVVLVRDADQVVLGRGTTDADGRVARLNDEPLAPGDLTLTFDVDAYISRTHGTVFHPRITLHVRLDGTRQHYHLPVLAGPFSHTTYLGS